MHTLKYKYRLYPNKEQLISLSQITGSVRYIWNYFLDVKSIQEKMGRVTQDKGFSIFRAMILYKAALYGKETVIIDRYFPSSQLCSGCGAVQKMPLSFRTYDCKCCGLVIDRDLNAAYNIHGAGTALSAFGDNQLVDESVVIGKLIGVNEEGSYAL